MKARKIREGLEERQRDWDSIKDPKYKAATRRPGSLNSSAPGPLRRRNRR